MRRLTLGLLLLLGVAIGLAAEWGGGAAMNADTAADFAVGCLLLSCGLIASERQPRSRVGGLFSLTGFTWFAGTAWEGALYLHRGPLVHVLLSYPTGRLRGRFAQTVVAATYVDGAIESVGSNDRVTLVLCLLVVAAAAVVYLRTSGPTRPASALALAATLVFAGVLAVIALGWVSLHDVWVYDIALSAVSVALAAGLVRGRSAEAVLTRLVVDLGAPEKTGTMRMKLAAALEDPSLVLAYRLRETGRFVDDAGHPLEIDAPGPGRIVTPIKEGDELVAVLVHGDALLSDRKLVQSVAAAARLAVANARLQAERRARAAELEASRRRIVEAEDAQSRRLEAELRLGAEQRLDGVAGLLADARVNATPAVADSIGDIEAEVQESLRELREFAQGVHPAALAEGGLMQALPRLAERSVIPVRLTGTIDRLPAPAEAALFFVCSEALANAAKHARASTAEIEVATRRGVAILVVVDDGVGGADLRRGSGLRGLADRIEALGGRLVVDSASGAGTRIAAELPLPSGPGSRAAPRATPRQNGPE